MPAASAWEQSGDEVFLSLLWYRISKEVISCKNRDSRWLLFTCYTHCKLNRPASQTFHTSSKKSPLFSTSANRTWSWFTEVFDSPFCHWKWKSGLKNDSIGHNCLWEVEHFSTDKSGKKKDDLLFFFFFFLAYYQKYVSIIANSWEGSPWDVCCGGHSPWGQWPRRFYN